jgi:carboxyl-terminal processing protease
MKIKSFLIFALLIGVASLFAFYPKKSASTSERESIILRAIISFIEQVHFRPLPLDDTFSKNVYDDYLNVLDRGKRFLIQDDINKLKPYETTIDDEIKAGNLDFFDLSLNLLNSGIERSRVIYQDILSHPMSFHDMDSVQVEYDSLDFAKNVSDLKNRWKSVLKYEVLQEVVRMKDAQDKDSTITAASGKMKTLSEFEIEGRKNVLDDFNKMFDRIAKLRREDRLNDFYNIIAGEFDPHTNYLDPRDKEDFDIGMSGKLIGIGARLQADGDYIKVIEIVPGGPAWKEKNIQANDMIIKVRQETGDALDIRGMRIDDVVAKIRGEKGTKVTLTIKKPNGTMKDVTLTRDEVLMEEGFAKSAILNLSGTVNNVGYIYLPKFYADFQDNDGRFSYSDVAKEIEKLKGENVSGIILDLRNNPGGSLNDVIKMGGFFIKSGPIVQVKSRDRSPYVMNDDDPTYLYDGPLVILVNQNSASASEIMASAMQDYKRAIIIGGKSTYGKGTVQRLFDLDRAIRGNDDIKPLGDVKATIQKYYRINGGSTQLKGVIPDIVLPDMYNYIETGEAENKHAMEWTKVAPATYSQDVYEIHNYNQIVQNSQKRVSQNPIFNSIDANARRIKTQMDKNYISLNIDTYTAELHQRKLDEDKFNKQFKVIESLTAQNLKADLPAINKDSVDIARNKSFITNLRKDVYLEEALRVIKDMQTNSVAEINK